MEKLNLKQILSIEDIQGNIESNLFKTNNERKIAIDKTLNSNKENKISVETLMNGNVVYFENTLYFDEKKEVYLLECRLFSKESDTMINAYLEILDSNGNIKEEYVDDVWDYADWNEI